MSEHQNNLSPETPKENEIADYYEGVKKLEMEGHETGIKKARNALFITAGLVLLGEVISMSMTGVEITPLVIGIIAVEVGVFVGLAFWTKTKPYAAIITGLILFILLWVAAAVVNDDGGQSIYKGIIVKAIIIYTLVSALKPAKEWENLKKNS
jgi:hypothetical protein